MRARRLLLLLTAAILVAGLTLAALVFRTSMREADQASDRYRSQAEAAWEGTQMALHAAALALPAGRHGASTFTVDSAGRVAAPKGTSSSRRHRVRSAWSRLRPVVEAEVDARWREGHKEDAIQRLLDLAAASPAGEEAASALATAAALERELGHPDRARDLWKRIVATYPESRDRRGTRFADSARYLLARQEAEGAPEKAAESLLALLEELVEAYRTPGQLAQGALKARVASQLETLARERALPEELRRGFARARARDHELARERRVRFALATPFLREWLEAGPPEDVRIVDLPKDPTLTTAQEAVRVVVATQHTDGQTRRIGVLELSRFCERALAQPEVAAVSALGFRASLLGLDGRRLGSTSRDEGSEPRPEPEPLVQRPAAAPLQEIVIAIRGTGKKAFLQRERRRFLRSAALAVGAVAVLLLAAAAMVWAVRRELQVARTRENFVAAVTHELKTPLASIRLIGELLAERDVGEDRARRFARRIVAQADRLSRMVASVLNLAKLQRGQEGVRQPVDLVRLLRDAATTFQLAVADKGYRVALTIKGRIPDVLADPDALASTVLNLLDNAAKYSDEPHTIELRARPVSLRGGPGVSVQVCDRGFGVPSGERGRIFEPFGRGGDELTRRRPGVGLGLALARQIAEAHGGTLRHAPRPGGGSVFTLQLPALPPDAGEPEDPEERE